MILNYLDKISYDSEFISFFQHVIQFSFDPSSHEFSAFWWILQHFPSTRSSHRINLIPLRVKLKNCVVCCWTFPRWSSWLACKQKKKLYSHFITEIHQLFLRRMQHPTEWVQQKQKSTTNSFRSSPARLWTDAWAVNSIMFHSKNFQFQQFLLE